MLSLVRRKEMIVFLEHGTAAGGVGDDGVDVFAKKCGEILSSEIAGAIANARMRGQRAAAKLVLWDDHFAAVSGEDADGGFVELRKSDVGYAAREEGHAGAARTDGRKRPAEAAKEKTVVDAREETFALGHTKKFQDTNTARDALQTGALIKTQNACDVDDAMGIEEQVPENKVARDAGKPGAEIVALDAGAGVLDQLSIFDSGRAGGLAGAAVETFVDVIDERIGDGLLVQLDMNHLLDAAARRIGFEIPEAVGGAGVEAETAVYAARIVFVDGNEAGYGRGGHRWVRCEGTMIRPRSPDRKNRRSVCGWQGLPPRVAVRRVDATLSQPCVGYRCDLWGNVGTIPPLRSKGLPVMKVSAELRGGYCRGRRNAGVPRVMVSPCRGLNLLLWPRSLPLMRSMAK